MNKWIKRLALSGVCTLAILGATGAVIEYSGCADEYVHWWGTDDTEFHKVAANSDKGTADRDAPVYIEAQVERLYGLHIGTPVKVRFKVVSLNSTQISFEPLEHRVLSRYHTTWRLYDTPHVVSTVKKDGYTTRVIEMTVAVWEPPTPPQPPEPEQKEGAQPPTAKALPPVDAYGREVEQPPPGELWPFKVEFLYSTDKVNGVQQWEYIDTPPVRFGFASLADPGVDLKKQATTRPGEVDGYDVGPMGDIPAHPNSLAMGLIGLSGVLTLSGLIYAFLLLKAWVRRLKAPRPVPEATSAFRAAMATAQATRGVRPYHWQFGVAFRDRVGGAAKTDGELVALWHGHPLEHRIAGALQMLDHDVRLTDGIAPATEDRLTRLVAELDAIDWAALYPPTRFERFRNRLTEPFKRIWKLAPSWRRLGRSKRSE